MERKWHHSWPAIIAGFLLCFIPGFVLLWLRPGTSTKNKAIVTAAVVALIVFSNLTSDPTDKSTDANAEPSASPTFTPIKDLLQDWAAPETLEDDYIPYQSGAFIGRVVGYGDPDSYTNDDNIQWIELTWRAEDEYEGRRVGRGAVKLAFVAPRELSECGGDYAPKMKITALEALQNALPIGSQVLAVPASDSDSEKRFLHIWPLAGDSPSELPPNRSINEELVATGAWMPFDYAMDIPYETYDAQVSEGAKVEPYPKKFALGQLSYLDEGYIGDYLHLLLAAGDKALVSTVPGQQCTDAFHRYLKNKVKEQKEYDREMERWRWEYEHNNSGGYCRDGDGDGICYES